MRAFCVWCARGNVPQCGTHRVESPKTPTLSSVSQTGHRDCEDQRCVLSNLRDRVVTLAVLAVLIGILAVIDPRVGESMGQVTSSVQNQGLSTTGAPLVRPAMGIVSLTTGFAADNPFLFWFLVGALVLFVLMVKV